MKFSTLVKIFALLAISAVIPVRSSAQDDLGGISGNFQLDVQSYSEDTLIGAQAAPERIRSNGFLNVNYTKGKFSAGLRYEMYAKEILGFDPRWGGTNGNTGIMYRYAQYSDDNYEVTLGSFYEQFGSGMILRSYEERGLGLDNAFDGIRLRGTPSQGINLTGFIGKQRSFFDYSPGIVRGADAGIDVNDVLQSITNNVNPLGNLQLRLGGSIVSKFQRDEDPLLKLPENVLAYSARMQIGIGDFGLTGEYVHKINDPTSSNQMSYNIGQGLYLAASYSAKGIGVNITAKSLDNMDFRSNRSATLTNTVLNFLPALAKQYSYRLLTLYPYATQPNGEIGLQGDVFYTIPKGSALGGDYGTNISLNFSTVYSRDTTHIDRFTYDGSFLKPGKRKYFEDINIEIQKTWSKTLKTTLGYVNQYYDKETIEGHGGFGAIRSNVIIADIAYSLNTTKTIRMELQHLSAQHFALDAFGEPMKEANGDYVKPELDRNNGNWAYGLIEYTIAPSWFISAFDEYNYGNDDTERRLHYISGNVSFVKDAFRIAVGYGRIRGGILCVGGVCRPVPASNGFSLSVSSSF
ncbi:hypothetical protein MASR2M18_00170 [Ignavibacteria bacterium]|nr:hypothetical protein [Bacteroidota bacterium]MCZ2131783.1 DUF6029 family protein [Bacteroidota bacterium]